MALHCGTTIAKDILASCPKLDLLIVYPGDSLLPVGVHPSIDDHRFVYMAALTHEDDWVIELKEERTAQMLSSRGSNAEKSNRVC